MSVHRRLLKASLKKRRVKLSATQIIAIGFAAIILLGAGLLTLPAASRSGVSCGFFPALFTATSATCVTGLVLFDTYTQWSSFGQVVIITLIEIGGLGFMSAASTFVFLLRKKVGLETGADRQSDHSRHWRTDPAAAVLAGIRLWQSPCLGCVPCYLRFLQRGI